MKIIVAIGGGETGRIIKSEDGTEYQTPLETTPIDRLVIGLANKPHPKVLFIGTATHDKPAYPEFIRKQYVENLGCSSLETLCIETEHLSFEEIRNKVLATDIIYVGGGDTTHMLKVWKEQQLDKILREAYEKGIILAGISAGAICWFEWYDNMDDIDTIDDLALVQGLGFVKEFGVPHYNWLSKEERNKINSLLKAKNISGIAIDDCAAVVFRDNNIEFVSDADYGSTVKHIP